MSSSKNNKYIRKGEKEAYMSTSAPYLLGLLGFKEK